MKVYDSIIYVNLIAARLWRREDGSVRPAELLPDDGLSNDPNHRREENPTRARPGIMSSKEMMQNKVSVSSEHEIY